MKSLNPNSPIVKLYMLLSQWAMFFSFCSMVFWAMLTNVFESYCIQASICFAGFMLASSFLFVCFLFLWCLPVVICVVSVHLFEPVVDLVREIREEDLD